MLRNDEAIDDDGTVYTIDDNGDGIGVSHWRKKIWTSFVLI